MGHRFRIAADRAFRALFASELRDDAGGAFELRGPREVAMLADTNADLQRLADRLAVITSSVHRDPLIRVRSVGVIVGVVVAVIILSIALAASGVSTGRMSGVMIAVGVCVACFAGAMAIRRGAATPLAPLLVEAVIEEGLCPACAYSLAGTPPADGRVTCPECGAHWRAERIRRYAQVAPLGGERTLRRVASLYVDHQARGWERRRVEDDRGRIRAVIAMRRARAILRSSPGDASARLAEAIAELRPLGRVKRAALCCFFVLMTANLVFVAWPRLAVPASISGLGAFLQLAGLLIWPPMAVAVLLSDVGRRADEVRGALLARRLCPACAEDLLIVPPDADGCTSCPTCGSAWHLAAHPRLA